MTLNIFDASLQSLQRALDVRGQKHTALAGDLANADTPGFSPVDINFDAAMEAAASADAAGTAPLQVEANAGDGEAIAGAPGLDGNRVDVDRTLAALAENGMQYGAAARAASKKLAILRYVAGDGVG